MADKADLTFNNLTRIKADAEAPASSSKLSEINHFSSLFADF
jgi:hypothetical protein